jgi:hypothetical protein
VICSTSTYRIVDGKRIEFPKLKHGQIGKLIAAWQAEDRAALLRSCDDAKVVAGDRLKALQEHDRDTGHIGWAFRRLLEYRHATETIELSLASQTPPTGMTVEATGLGPDAVVDLATELWGLKSNEAAERLQVAIVDAARIHAREDTPKSRADLLDAVANYEALLAENDRPLGSGAPAPTTG